MIVRIKAGHGLLIAVLIKAHDVDLVARERNVFPVEPGGEFRRAGELHICLFKYAAGWANGRVKAGCMGARTSS